MRGSACGETVAGTAHRLNQLVVACRFQRLAQPPDMHVDRALLDKHMIAHTWSSTCTRVYTRSAWVMKKMQQPEFGRPQLQRLAIAGHAVAGRIEMQAGNLDDVIRGLRRTPPQQRLDAGIEFARRKRFGDVVIGTGFEPGELVLLLGAPQSA